jgi:ketosteroid isomerase-like protein
MYGWLIRSLARRAFQGLGQGDPSFLTTFLADDVEFHFPGRSPFAAHHHSKQASDQWLRRFAHFRPRFEIHEVIASGPPWDIRACIRFTDVIGDPSDPTPYVNEGVCLLTFRWGRVVSQRAFLDTQAVADFFGTESSEEFFADLAD